MNIVKMLYDCNNKYNNCVYCVNHNEDGCRSDWEAEDSEGRILACVNGIGEWLKNNEFPKDTREIARILFFSGYDYYDCCLYCANHVEQDDDVDDNFLECISVEGPKEVLDEDGVWRGTMSFSHCIDGIEAFLKASINEVH